MGLAYGLIQKKSVDVNDIRFVWTWQCMLGISVSGIVFYSAGSLANLFAKPEAEFIFQSLSLVVLINAVTSLSTNLLKKSLNYQGITSLRIVQLFSWIWLCRDSFGYRRLWRSITSGCLASPIG